MIPPTALCCPALWVKMCVRRINEFAAKKLEISKMDPRQPMKPFVDASGADTFCNLFEMPVLFYALAIFLALTKNNDILFSYGA